MRINDPSLWPAQLGDLRFDSPSEKESNEIRIVSARGDIVGLLFRHDGCSVDQLHQSAEFHVPAAEGWELVMKGGDGKVIGRNMLFGRVAEQPATLTDDIAAWATLTLLSRMVSRSPARG
jgi:hypothetical protein